METAENYQAPLKLESSSPTAVAEFNGFMDSAREYKQEMLKALELYQDHPENVDQMLDAVKSKNGEQLVTYLEPSVARLSVLGIARNIINSEAIRTRDIVGRPDVEEAIDNDPKIQGLIKEKTSKRDIKAEDERLARLIRIRRLVIGVGFIATGSEILTADDEQPGTQAQEAS